MHCTLRQVGTKIETWSDSRGQHLQRGVAGAPSCIGPSRCPAGIRGAHLMVEETPMTNSPAPTAEADGETTHIDVVVVGAGFSGLYAIYTMRSLGLTVQCYELGGGVGGTWYWNRYPGARCDTESLQYSFSFSPELEQEWVWSERFATQPEILRYLEHVAERFDLLPAIQLKTKVTALTYLNERGRWEVETDRAGRVEASFVVMASGNLSVPNAPQLEGLSRFTGEIFHTGDWPHQAVDFRGKRVAVIGTGSSGIQVIPRIAEQADHLYVFQRTPQYSVPASRAHLSDEYVADIKANYPRIREETRRAALTSLPFLNRESAKEVDAERREQVFQERWADCRGAAHFLTAFNDLLVDDESNALAGDFIRSRIRETVRDPETAERLCPIGYPFGSKRLCLDMDYYETFNRENVTLIDLREQALQSVAEGAVTTTAGAYEVDAIVLATGYDGMTGALTRIDIRGVDGSLLREVWAHGPLNYLGLQVAGFPNLFTVTGPGSPSVIGSVVTSIEQHIEFIRDLMVYMRAHDLATVEADGVAQKNWVEHVNEVANKTLFVKGNSWWQGANIEGKPRIFMPYAGGVGPYRTICEDVAADNFRGFTFGPASQFTGQ